MTPAAQQQRKKTHLNDERTVHCPVGECDETPLARGVHLHVMRSSGNGHGPQGEVPTGITFDDLETAGSREVSMDYPETRETEKVRRLCPHCRQPFHGKHGVQIHLGQVAGDEHHPKDAKELHDPADYPIAHVDQHGNVKEVVEGEELLPTTEQRREDDTDDVDDAHEKTLRELRELGILDEQAIEDARQALTN